MKEIFIELQRAAGFKNIECGLYLGISEGAVKDRRSGTYEPKFSELIALAISGTAAELAAKELIQSLCQHEISTLNSGDKYCRICKKEITNDIGKINTGAKK